MKYNFKLLHKTIIKWFDLKINSAPDVKLAKAELLKELNSIAKYLDKPDSIKKLPQFQRAYFMYRKGSFQELEELFLKDNELVKLITEKQRNQLIEEGLLKVNANNTAKNSGSLKNQKGKRKYEVHINTYEFKTVKVKTEIYKTYKLLFFYSEIPRLYQNDIAETKSKREFANKNHLWFKVGVAFAIGKVHEVIKKYGENSAEVARQMGNENFRPYISESLSRHNKSDKNIYSDVNKLKVIRDHCLSEGIKMTKEFLDLTKSL